MVLKRAADLAEAIYAVPTTQHRGITDYSRYGAAVSNVSSVANNVHEAVSAAGGHGYNEAVEDYNRAQHNSSSSPSRGYTNGLFFTFTYSYLSNKRTCLLILFKKKVQPTL